MAGNATVQDPMELMRDLCSAEIWDMKASTVSVPPRRFEAIFFASEGYRSVNAMLHSGLILDTVGDVANVVWHGIQTRVFVDDFEHGLPYINTSAMMEARPKPAAYLSRKATKNVNLFEVKKGIILISMSGSVGNIRLVDDNLDGWAVTVDALRVETILPENLGPLYCFLQSSLGQFLLKKNETGSVVRHIYDSDVKGLPIPRLPRALRVELTRLINEASSLRVEANRLLNEADEMVQKQLNLPDIEEFFTARHIANGQNAIVFPVSAREGVIDASLSRRRRLDATSHDPAISALREHLRTKDRTCNIRSVSSRIWRSSLRERSWVEDLSYGVPLLTGKDLTSLRFKDLGYLSRLHTKNIKKEQAERHLVLVTCGGTLGRTAFVHRNMEGFVISEDVMRIKTLEKKIAPAFLFAFLTSPYGQLQLEGSGYGSVQKKLRDFQVGDVLLSIPEDKGASIGSIVQDAFDARADAIELEDQAFALFMAAMKQGRNKIESEWGGEY